MNNKAQMMVLESVLFAITAVLAIYFIVQLSPTTLQVGVESTDDIKTLGDNALNAIYTEKADIVNGGLDLVFNRETDNPTSKLTVWIIMNMYGELTLKLDQYLPDNVFFNVYITNGTTIVFLCSSGSTPIQNPKLPTIDPVVISHRIISIDPIHLTGFFDNNVGIDPYKEWQAVSYTESYIAGHFAGYEQTTYDVILEMWSV